MAISKTRDFFLWMDDKVKLLLPVTQKYKAAAVVENVNWESSQQVTLWRYTPKYREPYPSPEKATAMGKDFPHKKARIPKRYVA